MKILRTKLFTERIADKYNWDDPEWIENTKKEAERNKLRDKKMKSLTPHERLIAKHIGVDTDDAGNKRYEKNQNKSRAIGAGIGASVGVAGALLSKKLRGRVTEGTFIAPALSAAAGSLISDAITKKKNRRIAEKIWEQGDKEQMKYITANKKGKKKFIETYTPIENRVDKNGEYTKTPKKYGGPSLEERARKLEKTEKELKKKFVEALKKGELSYENTKKGYRR